MAESTSPGDRLQGVARTFTTLFKGFSDDLESSPNIVAIPSDFPFDPTEASNEDLIAFSVKMHRRMKHIIGKAEELKNFHREVVRQKNELSQFVSENLNLSTESNSIDLTLLRQKWKERVTDFESSMTVKYSNDISQLQDENKQLTRHAQFVQTQYDESLVKYRNLELAHNQLAIDAKSRQLQANQVLDKRISEEVVNTNIVASRDLTIRQLQVRISKLDEEVAFQSSTISRLELLLEDCANTRDGNLNFEYLKNVLLKFMSFSSEAVTEKRSMIIAIGLMMKFSEEELQNVLDQFDSNHLFRRASSAAKVIRRGI